ncbi:MAG: regulatory protein RecX [Jiangellales bacterium]
MSDQTTQPASTSAASAASSAAAAPGRGRDADPVEVARLILLRQLTRGPRTRAQLAEACRRREVPQAAADQVLDRFTELGLVDDGAFADAWVQSRHGGRGLSRRALRHELKHRGVADETIETALEQIDGDDERAAAVALVRARLPSLHRYDQATQRRRLHGLLVRRGYSPGVAGAVVNQVIADVGSVTD